MAVLLIAELDGNRLSLGITAKALTAARQLGDVTILCAGQDCRAAADTAATLEGVVKVLLADDAAYAHGLAEPLGDLVVALAGGYDHIVAASSSMGKNVLPRVAALLDVMVLSDVTRVVDASTFERPIYAGNAIQTVRSNDAKKVLTVRTSVFNATGTGGAAPIETAAAAGAEGGAQWLADEVVASVRPDLASARIVVSGGRALGSAEGFKIIEQLADTLGAAVGASRAAVDAGYVPSDSQVGQTGKVVAPDLYIAIGISGAIQHIAGMREAKVIVAINKDADAPIFKIADYGLVADLFQVLPQLQQALAK